MEISWQDVAAIITTAGALSTGGGLIATLAMRNIARNEVRLSINGLESSLRAIVKSEVAAEVGKLRVETGQEINKMLAHYAELRAMQAVITQLQSQAADHEERIRALEE